jgi:hypothetical protein
MRPRSHTLLTSKRDANKTRVVLSHHRPQQQSSGLTSETFPPPLCFFSAHSLRCLLNSSLCVLFFCTSSPSFFHLCCFFQTPLFFSNHRYHSFFFLFLANEGVTPTQTQLLVPKTSLFCFVLLPSLCRFATCVTELFIAHLRLPSTALFSFFFFCNSPLFFFL